MLSVQSLFEIQSLPNLLSQKYLQKFNFCIVIFTFRISHGFLTVKMILQSHILCGSYNMLIYKLLNKQDFNFHIKIPFPKSTCPRLELNARYTCKSNWIIFEETLM